MTRAQAIRTIMGSLERFPAITSECDTRSMAEVILMDLDEVIKLDPTIMELSATLRGVGRLAHGNK